MPSHRWRCVTKTLPTLSAHEMLFSSAHLRADHCVVGLLFSLVRFPCAVLDVTYEQTGEVAAQVNGTELTVRPCSSVQLHRCSSEEKTLGPCVCRHLFTPTSLRCPACLCQAQPHSGSLQPMACWLASSLSLVLPFLPQRIAS